MSLELYFKVDSQLLWEVNVNPDSQEVHPKLLQVTQLPG